MVTESTVKIRKEWLEELEKIEESPPPLDDEEKSLIIKAYNSKKHIGYRKIAKIIGRSPSTVFDFIKKMKNESSTD